MDFKNAKVSIPLAMILAGAAYAGDYYLSHTYVAQSSLKQMRVDDRIFDLRDAIQDVRDDAHRQNRQLNDWDKAKIERLKTEIRKLGGTP